MSKEETVLRFEEVSFDYGHNHPHFKRGGFSLRKGMKVALMGQNRRWQEHHLPAHSRRLETRIGQDKY